MRVLTSCTKSSVMRAFSSTLASIVVVTAVASAHAQSVQPGGSQASISVPRVVKFNGVFQPADGQPPASTEIVTVSIYADQEGGVALWQETQSVTVDPSGRFTVLLGASQPEGLPLEVFASGEARWMSLDFARAGEVERPRVRFTSVPYALKAGDAETLGGRPASDFVLTPGSKDRGSSRSGAAKTDASTLSTTEAPLTPADILPGTTNHLAKYLSAANLGNSAVIETGGKVGIGTSAPLDFLHVRFTNTTGALTGFAVQNLGNNSTSYSGMLFYDQFGALAQFQGFNNITHEYRINNIASSGSINFMLGTSRLKMDTTDTTITGPTSVVGGAVNTALAVTNTSTDNTSAAIDTSDAVGYGIFATTDTGTAVFGSSTNVAAAWAGFFDGDVNVTGTLTKAAGAFRIDHPLDPEHKYLSHSFVESPDMKNIYDGVAVFDAAGEATVTLPDWFEALNGDFRYQLTPMGAAFVPYVAQEIAGNQFKIGGGVPGRKVSWQVTGIRHDAYANAHRIAVEEMKPDAAVGTYQNPDAFGQPVEMGRSTLAAEDKPTAKGHGAARTDAMKARLRAISPKPAKQ